MGNRLLEDVCLSCGGILIHPYNDYRTCSKCTEIVKKALHDYGKKKERKEIHTRAFVNKGGVVLQTKPRGQTVK